MSISKVPERSNFTPPVDGRESAFVGQLLSALQQHGYAINQLIENEQLTSVYSIEGEFTVTSSGTTTELIDGLASRAVYLVTATLTGSNMEVQFLGAVVSGNSDVVSKTVELLKGDFNLGALSIQPKGGASPYTFSAGNGTAFEFVCTGDGSADRTCTYRLLRLL